MIRDYQSIEGLLWSEFINEKKQKEVWEQVYEKEWCTDLIRRTQHYGYKYDYRNRRIDISMKTEPLPDWANNLSIKLVYCGLLSSIPDQMIVNEYLPGQGIAQHVDCVPCFKDEIATISLGSVYEMEMVNLKTKERKKFDLNLGSCLVFSGPSRYNWTHGIWGRFADNGRPRGTRISLTFRKVILNG